MSESDPNPLAGVKATVGPDILEKIQQCKILLVGSGGIGCELLKNLALTGFRYVEVIDLDTIDVSNLNRQLLFRSHHVGKPKCVVACEVAAEMTGDPSAKYLAHHGNVCNNDQFNVHFCAKFDLVLNALDNVTARRRVNRLCLAAGVPLVEAGTTGYLGQVNVIDKASNVACYECYTQETQKVYPICTIRSTPSMPVHTIVWAKELYKLLFGEKADESMLYEDPEAEEPSTYMPSVLEFRKTLEDKSKKEEQLSIIHAMITAFYVDEIKKQLDMGRYKGAKKTPVPLDATTIPKAATTEAPPTKQPNYQQTSIWSAEECLLELCACLLEADPETLLPSFDKDDALAMRFVTASSNLRSYVFSIDPIQSFYSAKGIAGNIIPAIATTNAIVSGLQMLQVIKILRHQLKTKQKTGDLDQVCQYVNCIRNKTRNGLFLTASKLEKPNPVCFVCRQATISLSIDVHQWNLADFLEHVLKKSLGFQEPTLMVDGDIFWEEGDEADTAAFAVNSTKKLAELPGQGVKNGTVLRVEDFSQDLEVDICVTHQDVWEGDQYKDNPERRFTVGGEKPQVAAPVAAAQTAAADQNDDDDDDDIIVVLDDPKESSQPSKRPLEDSSNGEPKKKKAKTSNGGETTQEVIEID